MLITKNNIIIAKETDRTRKNEEKMVSNLTEEQIMQLAPDASSIKAGKNLAQKLHWVWLAQSERAIWGHCQGSGKTPYQTVVDTQHIAFKCSCPSRKFPCKHGLGLLLLYAREPKLFQQEEEPEWVTAWLNKREEKEQQKEQKKQTPAPVANEAAQVKRQQQRHQKVLQGIDDLETWMKDLIRNGLLKVPERASTLFETISRRMVDAQASGLANRLRNMQNINYYEEGWKYTLTEQLSKLYLLMQAYRQLEAQPEDWQAEIRTQIGYLQSKEEVLAGEAITGQWTVIDKQSTHINDLRVDVHWLYNINHHNLVVHQQFTPNGAIPEFQLIADRTYTGTLYLYKGISNPRRVLIHHFTLSPQTATPDFHPNLSDAAATYRQRIQENPLAENVPLLIGPLTLVSQDKQWYVQDADHRLMPVSIDEPTRIHTLAITGGKAFSAFVLANACQWEVRKTWSLSETKTLNPHEHH